MDYSFIISLSLLLCIICIFSSSSLGGFGGIYYIFRYLEGIEAKVKAWISGIDANIIAWIDSIFAPFEGGQPIGGSCNLSTDCKGWGPAKGTVCCDGICSKPGCQKAGIWYCQKDCGLIGDKCTAPSGTIWPFSGCDISAGLCCDGKCSTTSSCGCRPFDQGCSSHTQCCSKKCNQLNGVDPDLACPCGYVDHGSYACCKRCWPFSGEDKGNCPKWSCGA